MNPFDSLKALHRKIFVKEQEAIAQEVAADRFVDQRDMNSRVAKAAAQTIDLVNELAADGNPHKQRVAAIINDTVVHAVEQHVANGGHAVQEERGAVEADPFSGPLSGSSTPTSEKSLPDSPTKALPHPTEPPKRGRGRPPKHKG